MSRKLEGRPRKHVFRRGERLVNKKKGETRWTYIKDVQGKWNKRRVLVQCDCGSIESRYLSAILNGKSTGCRRCMTPVSIGSVIKPDSMRQQSLNVGKTTNYFHEMKVRNPEMLETLRCLGGGRLDDGYWRYHEIKEKHDKAFKEEIETLVGKCLGKRKES